ncbi:MAG: CopD family protein [Gemmatimonadota bacterium]
MNRNQKHVARFALLLGLLVPGAMAAHLGLASSNPSRGDTLRTAVSSVHLTFTLRIELRFTSVMVVTATGDTIRGEIVPTDTLGRAVELRLSQPLLNGNYVVLWRTAGADGHAVTGNYDFVVTGVSPPATVPTMPQLAGDGGRPVVLTEVADVNQQPLAVAVRWLNFLFAVLLVGGVVIQMLVGRHAGPYLAEYWTAVSLAARRVALFAAAASLLLSAPRLFIQLESLSGPGAAPGFLSFVLRETSWGRGWVLQLLGGSGYLLAAFAAAPGAVGAWRLAAAASVMVAFGISFSGHAAGVEQMQIINVANDAVHIMAVSAWIGTLIYIVLVGVPTAVRLRTYGELGTLVRTFSPLALGVATIAIITGGISALSHLGPLSDLWTTPYGRMLLLKLVAVAGVAIGGAYNWKRIKPRLGTEAATNQLQRSASGEVVLALLVLVATAILVALPTP